MNAGFGGGGYECAQHNYRHKPERAMGEHISRNDNHWVMLDVGSVKEAASRRRLRWLGYVKRFSEARLPKMLGGRGRPRKRGNGT